MRRAGLGTVLSAVLAASLLGAPGQAATRLTITISRLEMVARGRVGFDVAIGGWQRELRPTMGGMATIGDQSVRVGPFPAIASRIPTAIDVARGSVTVGGDASVAEFRALPPFTQNTPMTVEITVRQGQEVATARQSGTLLLPTVVIAGYLNEISAPDSTLVSALAQRGYRASGPSPNLFWFSYNSRALSLQQAAQGLAAYVHDLVIPKAYAARINVVGYSLGGLMARWNMAFEPGWDHLVNRFLMVGVPNEGVVASYVYGEYPLLAPWVRTPACRDMLPAFPFWRQSVTDSWTVPADAQNPVLARLNAHPLPDGVQVYAFYGDRQPGADGRGTLMAVTGDDLPSATFASGAGDGFVLTRSALGLPINGGGGVPGLADRLVMKVDLGPVGHTWLLAAAASKIADVLTDQGTADQAGTPAPADGR